MKQDTEPTEPGDVLAGWLTTKQAAQLAGYHPVYLGDLARAGKVKARKVGRSWIFWRDDLLRYRAECGRKD